MPASSGSTATSSRSSPLRRSLVWNQMRVQSDSADPAWIGREWLRKTLRRREIAKHFFRERSNVPRIDVTYEAMNADWCVEIERIYRFLDMEFTLEARTGMQQYLASATLHRGHAYSLEQFGLSSADVESATASFVA